MSKPCSWPPSQPHSRVTPGMSQIKPLAPELAEGSSCPPTAMLYFQISHPVPSPAHDTGLQPQLCCLLPRSAAGHSAQPLIPGLVQFQAISKGLQLLWGGPNCPVCAGHLRTCLPCTWVAVRPGPSIRASPALRVAMDETLFCYKPHLHHCPRLLGVMW